MVIRGRLIYGLDSMMLLDSHLALLRAFQLKVLRQILKLKTTFIDRRNTNELVFDRANQAKLPGSAPILPIDQYIQETQLKHLGHLIRADNDDPTREVTPSQQYQPATVSHKASRKTSPSLD